MVTIDSVTSFHPVYERVHKLENLDIARNLAIGKGVKSLLHSNTDIVSQFYVIHTGWAIKM